MNLFRKSLIPSHLLDFFMPAEIGTEPTPEAYIAHLVTVFRAVRRVLRDDGTLWLTLGDSYANDGKWGDSTGGKHVKALHGHSAIGRSKRHTNAKPKDLMMLPARVALALQSDGWWLRSDIIWQKPNAMPEPVKDRPTSVHEHVFLLTKQPVYRYNAEAIAEPAIMKPQRRLTSKAAYAAPGAGDHRSGTHGLVREEPGIDGGPMRNSRNVWTITTKPYKDAHFATMPPNLAGRCILAGSAEGDQVLDPFAGAGTTGLVAAELGRKATLIEISPAYAQIIKRRLAHCIRS